MPGTAIAMIGSHCRHSQRGLSLVELMVGIAIGLFVVAGATMLTSTQLSENRRLLLDTQVQQDLRATADIVSRELRRAGFWEDAHQAVSGPLSSIRSDRGEVSLNAKCETEGVIYEIPGDVVYRYYTPTGRTGDFCFVWDRTAHSIKFTIGVTPQDLTDIRTLKITDFSVTPLHVSNAPTIQIACEHKCPDDTADCWPKIAVREFAVVITGESVSDASVQRTVRSHVRVRNDAVEFNTGTAQVCPPPP